MRRLVPLILTALVFASVFVHAEDDLLLTRFGDYLNALRAQAGIPGLAAAIVGPADVTWERTFGSANIDRNLPVRYDTPFALDGTTETVVASLALRCASDGWLSLDDKVGKFNAESPDAALTVLELLQHTVRGPDGPQYVYRPDRLGPLATAIAGCTDSSFRFGIAGLFDRLAMIDSVPGADTASLVAHDENFTQDMLTRYADSLARMATPYAVDARNRPSASAYSADTMTPVSGMISSLRDLEQFDLALKKGVLLRPEWIALAWTPPVDAAGNRLPHGIGWFVQTYNNERVVWQFGVADDASSSIVITVPNRGLTLVLLANSSGLVRPYPLEEGNIAVSPFARVFLSLFLR